MDSVPVGIAAVQVVCHHTRIRAHGRAGSREAIRRAGGGAQELAQSARAGQGDRVRSVECWSGSQHMVEGRSPGAQEGLVRLLPPPGEGKIMVAV